MSQTQFTEWLSLLGNLRADLGTDGRQVRGLAVSHKLVYPGDVTDATLVGSVKAAPNAPAALATFNIGTPVFANGKTTWTFELSEAQTLTLGDDSDGDGVVTLLYDFLLELPGKKAERIAGGLFVLSGFITEPA